MERTAYRLLVTVSATYGTGGSIIAPRLADALGLPFVDRLISADLSQEAWRSDRAEQLQQPTASPDGQRPDRSEEGISEAEQASTPTGRFLSYFARAASVGVMLTPEAVPEDDESIRDRTVEGLRPIAAGAPAVLLGRAGAVVLATRPRSFHIRLDAPVQRRVEWGVSHEHLDLETAERRLSETDRARTLFVKRLFRVDPAEARLYHLILDPTVLGIDPSLELLVSATRAFVAANPGE